MDTISLELVINDWILKQGPITDSVEIVAIIKNGRLKLTIRGIDHVPYSKILLCEVLAWEKFESNFSKGIHTRTVKHIKRHLIGGGYRHNDYPCKGRDFGTITLAEFFTIYPTPGSLKKTPNIGAGCITAILAVLSKAGYIFPSFD
jgi:hypothetical protein